MAICSREFSHVDDVVVIVSAVDDCQGSLADCEREAIGNAVQKRAREFAAGRTLSRLALEMIGREPAAIPMDSDRLPVWPDGVVGSISHTDTTVGVAIADASDYRAVGFDLENDLALPPELHRLVFAQGEAGRFEQGLASGDAILAFCCKESVYKAVFPQVRESLEFHDIGIRIEEDRFRATVSGRLKSSDRVAAGRGYCSRRDGVVSSLFLV